MSPGVTALLTALATVPAHSQHPSRLPSLSLARHVRRPEVASPGSSQMPSPEGLAGGSDASGVADGSRDSALSAAVAVIIT